MAGHELSKQNYPLIANKTGWIMYLTAVHTLLTGGRAVLYDGSPFVPDATTFIKLVGEQK